MKKILHDERKTYDKFSLNLQDTFENPLKQFDLWYHQAEEHGGFEANAMVLSTSDLDFNVSSRVVLLKEYNSKGFIFFTNYHSRKGQNLLVQANCSLLFFYEAMQRQIRIDGVAEKISEEDSDAYFKTRPLDSQYGAMASPQSSALESKQELENSLARLKEENKKPQRPEHWGGYIVKPRYFEFWQGRPSRLHDRVFYKFENEQWTKGILAP